MKKILLLLIIMAHESYGQFVGGSGRNIGSAASAIATTANQRAKMSVPFLSMADLRLGGADTARIVQITDDLRGGVFQYNPSDLSSVDDSSMVIRYGTRRYARVYQGSINVKWFGAKGDGTTDDYAAIVKALAYVNTRALSLFLPKGTYYTKLSATLSLSAGVTMYGEDGTSINLDTNTPGYTAAFKNNGDNVVIRNVSINRSVDQPFVLFLVQAFKGFSFRNVKVNGNRDIYATNYCHAFQVGVNNSGVSEYLTIDNCEVKKVSYGLFMTNASTATVKNVSVTNSIFDSNTATDLEFNSPNGTFSNVNVENCRFSNGALFATGFAFIKSAKVTNCFFENYNNEPVHIEDYSEDISIQSNSFKSCALTNYAYIQIISGARRIRIQGNNFDASANTLTNTVVSALAGGSGTTPGGRSIVPPTNIAVVNNDVVLSSSLNGFYFETVTNFTISQNRIRSTGGVNSGVFSGANNYAMRVYVGQFGVISGNDIRGVNAGISSPLSNINGLTEGQLLSNNTFSNCLIGIAGSNPSAATITGNVFTGCQYSIYTGAYSTGVPKSTLISGNSAIRCTNPMLIYNSVKVTATGTATVGTGKTVTISALPGVLQSGTVITFASGAVLTLTATAIFQTTSLSGTVSVSGVLNGDIGTVYRRYSSDVTQAQTVFKNTDDFYGRSGTTLIKEVSANYQVIGYEEIVVVTANAPTITLPPVVSWNTQEIAIQNSSGSSATVARDATTDTVLSGETVRYRANEAGTSYIKIN